MILLVLMSSLDRKMNQDANKVLGNISTLPLYWEFMDIIGGLEWTKYANKIALSCIEVRLRYKDRSVIWTKLVSVSHCCKSCCYKTANIKNLSINILSTEASYHTSRCWWPVIICTVTKYNGQSRNDLVSD